MSRIAPLVAFVVGLSGQAMAQPAGLVSVNGYWQTSDGAPVFFYNAPWTPSTGILCGLECAGSAIPGGGRWQPVSVDDSATVEAPWGRTTIEGASVLTYRNKALFVWTADAAGVLGKPGFRPWRFAPDVEALAPIPASSPSITRRPEIDPNRTTFPDYPPASLRAKEMGSVALSLCLRPDGRIVWADIKWSSGITRLDEASLRYAFSGMVLTPAIAGDSAVAVCGVEKVVDWTIADAPPPPQAN